MTHLREVPPVPTGERATTNQRQDYILPLVTAGEVKAPAGSSNAGKSIAALQIASVTVESCRGISRVAIFKHVCIRPVGKEMKRLKHYNKFAVEDSRQRTTQDRVVNSILAFKTLNSTTYDKLI